MIDKALSAAAIFALSFAHLTTAEASEGQEIVDCASASYADLPTCLMKIEQSMRTRMKSAFDKALSQAPEGAKLAVRDEQKAWETYFGKACLYFQSRDSFGREGVTVHYPVCRTKIMESRVNQLENLFKRADAQ